MQSKIEKKFFCFWGKFIWTTIVKLSLLRTGYLSSESNLLTSSPKIWHVNKRDFFWLNWLGSDQWILWKCSDADFNIPSARLPCCFSKGPLKRDFLGIYLNTSSESVISKIQNLWVSSFFPKCFRFNLDFKTGEKNWQKVFCWWGNYIWIGIVKLCLLRAGYFWSAANVSTSSTKI